MPMPDILTVFIAIFATYRVAQFITYDNAPFNLMDKFRCYLGKKATSAEKYGFWWSMAELVNCPFCNGLWISLLFTLILFSVQPVFILIWLSIAGGQAWLESMVQSRS